MVHGLVYFGEVMFLVHFLERCFTLVISMPWLGDLDHQSFDQIWRSMA